MQLSRIFSLSILLAAAGAAQTTEGLISGRLLNSATGRPVGGASVVYSSSLTSLGGVSRSDESGYYYLPLLSPGFYRVRVTAPNYQAQEIQELELPVAARIELDFRLRPLSDVWEAGQYNSVFLPGSRTIVTFFGPDVDSARSGSFEAQKGRRTPLESTVSQVIDPVEIANLPLAGRDVYTMLVTQPGVTSDGATARGLGLSVNGQRPTASNFLLDGLENNNYLVTGPLTPVAPEAIQEYRVSTNNFSAEYGRTSGYLANAITRSGTSAFHGLAYVYLKNDALNANGFQENLNGAARNPAKEIQPGYFVGGPALKARLFFSSAFERLRSRSFQDPFTFLFPTTIFAKSYAAPGSLARKLLTDFPAPAVTNGNFALGQLTMRPPVSIDRSLAIERLDYIAPGGRDRLMGRGIVVQVSRPDFIWTPYKDFVTPLSQDTWAAGGSYIHAFRPSLTNELRLSDANDDLHWNRPHPEIPTLLAVTASPPAPGPTQIALPGFPSFYSYKNKGTSAEALDNVIWARGRHLITAGAGLLFRTLSGYLTAGQNPAYFFGTGALDGLFSFILDQPANVYVGLDRTAFPGALRQPDYNRNYRYNQYFAFAQDTFKIGSRLTVNYGLRYEYYGAPYNTGAVKDALLALGSGNSLGERIASAAPLARPGAGDERLFAADKHDWAARAGAAYDLFGNGRTLLRGAYGVFYDRPFDNLWQNLRSNDVILPYFTLNSKVNYLGPVSGALPALRNSNFTADFPGLTLMDPALRNGRVHSYFAGVQQRVSNDLTVEVNALGSYGHHLLSTDVINRSGSTPADRFNNALPDIHYRGNQGFSNYNALTAVARYRAGRGFVQGAYTWSHSIDNQSDPLAGDFFDLSITSVISGGGAAGRAAFSRQFDARADRGNSDFDQRHNFVVFSYWNLPAPFAGSKAGILFRNWTAAGLAGFRTGFPYTVVSTSGAEQGSGVLFNPRPDLTDPRLAVLANPAPAPGGKRFLSASGFADAPDHLGSLGRNALRGPGFYNVDLSLGRSFGLRWLGESGRLTLRADAFNALNHANLGSPDPVLNDGQFFGVATFGRQGRQSGFPAVAPLVETARQVQLLLRVQF